MNCSYRIAKNVHIGVRIRKTKDKNTVEFANEPVKDVKILKAWKEGYKLSHPDFPKEVWLDHDQLDITDMHIERGIIKDEITFVEAIAGRSRTNMVLIRTETFDYLELLDDKKLKEETTKYKPHDMEIGERCISSICRHGNPMVYLGTYYGVDHYQAYRYYDTDPCTKAYLTTTPKRAFFAYPDEKGKYSIKSYPIANKIVKELYKCSDKGQEKFDNNFTDKDKNINMLIAIQYQKSDYGKRCLSKEYWSKHDNYKHLLNSAYAEFVFIGENKKTIREEAIEFGEKYVSLYYGKPPKWYKTEDEFNQDNPNNRNRRW